MRISIPTGQPPWPALWQFLCKLVAWSFGVAGSVADPEIVGQGWLSGVSPTTGRLGQSDQVVKIWLPRELWALTALDRPWAMLSDLRLLKPIIPSAHVLTVTCSEYQGWLIYFQDAIQFHSSNHIVHRFLLVLNFHNYVLSFIHQQFNLII